MNRWNCAATMLATTMLAVAPPVIAQSRSDQARMNAAQARYDNETRLYHTELDRYQQIKARYGYRDQRYNGTQDYHRDGQDRTQGYSGQGYNGQGYSGQGYNGQGYAGQRADGQRPGDDRDESGYDAARYYRDGPNYQERTLSSDDRVYRGNDGRYYCKRNDGTTGLVIGAVGGGLLGNVIDGGHSRVVGTLLGGALGAFAGKSIDQSSSQVKCR